MKKVAAPIFLTAICLYATICIYQQSPLFNEKISEAQSTTQHPIQSPPTQYKTLSSSCESQTQYLQGAQRNGVAQSDSLDIKNFKLDRTIKPINAGIHRSLKASPVVDNTGIYIGSDTGWFFKLDHFGNILWKLYSPDSQNGIPTSASVDDQKVYFGSYNGTIYALDKSNGDLIWKNKLAAYMEASPLLADNGLFVAMDSNNSNGFVARIDCQTGEVLWISEWLGGYTQSSPAYSSTENSVLVGADSGRLYSIDAKSGETLWKHQVAGPIKSTPTVTKESVYFSSWDKNFHALNIKNGEPKWQTFMGGRLETSLSLVPEHTLGITNTKAGDITGLDLETGEILWRLHHGDNNHKFNVLVTQNAQKQNEYFAWSRCKETKLCALDAKTGKIITSFDLPSSFSNTPYSFNNQIYISLDDNNGLVTFK